MGTENEQLHALLAGVLSVDIHCKTAIGDRALCVEPGAMNYTPRAPKHMFKLLLQSSWAAKLCATCKKLYAEWP